MVMSLIVILVYQMIVGGFKVNASDKIASSFLNKFPGGLSTQFADVCQ